MGSGTHGGYSAGQSPPYGRWNRWFLGKLNASVVKSSCIVCFAANIDSDYQSCYSYCFNFFVDAFYESVCEAAVIARNAYEAETVQESADLWRKLFGNKFLLPQEVHYLYRPQIPMDL